MTNLQKYRQLCHWEDAMPSWLNDSVIQERLEFERGWLSAKFTEEDWEGLVESGTEDTKNQR